jgi:hypothetical protein
MKIIKPQIAFTLFIILFFLSCTHSKDYPAYSSPTNPYPSDTTLAVFFSNLTELKRCDILIKPNHNWMPGTTFIPGGSGFGHAVIVTADTYALSTDSLLRCTPVFESHSRDVASVYQVRTGMAYEPGDDFRTASLAFEPKNAGYRYRLRMDMTEVQKDSILAFIIGKDAGLSSWRAIRRLEKSDSLSNDSILQDKQYWYCTLLIWQAFYHVLGINIDANGGLVIYPNDVINSPVFDNTKTGKEKRVRF